MAKDVIVQIGGLVPAVTGLTPMSNAIILDGFRMALQGRFVQVHERRFEIVKVFIDPKQPGKILAQLSEHAPVKVVEPEKGAA